ncbi:outer membrane protein assembly factor BamE [Janthinobacterium sp.]|uniref:outer membrane protein assembly factor BamE domain-containing protein n=1 Tax=Janthinobacterium sp. TaxID=1871054 RepID=UPI00293D8122|nr:outer membrane protein assembly factor BamE [Janthinobacterium sp.]
MATFILALGLSGCAGLGGPPPALGEPRAALEAQKGRPTAIYPDGADTLLEYATGPYGQLTYMARIGPDGLLKSYEQVLTSEKYATIKVGVATKQDVLRAIGHPAETSFLPRQQLEVWSYRYKESGVWDSMMHVHFDQAGIVRMLMNGPDPMKEEHRGFFR